MDLFPIHHDKSGLTVRLARLPFNRYHALNATVGDLHNLYACAHGDVKLMLRRGLVRESLRWCLEQFPVQGFNPEPNWDWVVRNTHAVNKFFFKDCDGTMGELYAWAIATPDLEYGEPSDIPSCGDQFIDLFSGLVFQGQYQDAIALTSTLSLQDITRLNWRTAKFYEPKPSQQQKGIKKAKEMGIYDEVNYELLDKRHELMMAAQERLNGKGQN